MSDVTALLQLLHLKAKARLTTEESNKKIILFELELAACSFAGKFGFQGWEMSKLDQYYRRVALGTIYREGWGSVKDLAKYRFRLNSTLIN